MVYLLVFHKLSLTYLVSNKWNLNMQSPHWLCCFIPFHVLPFAIWRDNRDCVKAKPCFMFCLVISVCVGLWCAGNEDQAVEQAGRGCKFHLFVSECGSKPFLLTGRRCWLCRHIKPCFSHTHTHIQRPVLYKQRPKGLWRCHFLTKDDSHSHF